MGGSDDELCPADFELPAAARPSSPRRRVPAHHKTKSTADLLSGIMISQRRTSNAVHDELQSCIAAGGILHLDKSLKAEAEEAGELLKEEEDVLNQSTITHVSDFDVRFGGFQCFKDPERRTSQLIYNQCASKCFSDYDDFHLQLFGGWLRLDLSGEFTKSSDTVELLWQLGLNSEASSAICPTIVYSSTAMQRRQCVPARIRGDRNMASY